MKRILVLILVLITVFTIAACNDQGGKEKVTYEATSAHLYPAANPLFFDYEYFTFEVCGSEGELIWSNVGDARELFIPCTKNSISRYVGSVKEKDGWYIFTANKAYRSVVLSGENAKDAAADMVERATNQLSALDPESSYYEKYKADCERTIKLYSGEEIRDDDVLLEGQKTCEFKFKVNESGKITVLETITGDTLLRYTFEYGETGNIIRSVEDYPEDGEKWETSFRENGIPSYFFITDGVSGETTTFYCDENGTVTEEIPEA